MTRCDVMQNSTVRCIDAVQQLFDLLPVDGVHGTTESDGRIYHEKVLRDNRHHTCMDGLIYTSSSNVDYGLMAGCRTECQLRTWRQLLELCTAWLGYCR